MSEKPIELTEDNFECLYSVYGNSEPLIQITTISKDKSIELKQQILRALEFYNECGKVIVTVNPDGSMKVENLITDKVKECLLEYPKLKTEIKNLQQRIESIQGVGLGNLLRTQERQINQLKQFKQKIIEFVEEYSKEQDTIVNIDSDWDPGYWLYKIQQILKDTTN